MDNVIGDIEKEAKRQMLELKSQILKQSEKDYEKKIKITFSLDRGFPEKVILDCIDRYKPGVVVMGTKGTGDSSRVYMGSVTKKIIEKAPVPVLTIPEK